MRGKLILALLAAPAIAGAQQMTGSSARQIASDTTFHPISQMDAISLARQNNVQNIIAANTVRSATNSVRAARAGYLPQVTLSTGQNRSTGERVGPSGTLIPIVSQWTYTTGLAGQFTLFDAGKTIADVRTAQATVAAQQATLVNTEFNIDLQVKQAYNSILAARESETAARAQLATAQLQLQTSIAKVNAGAANVSDSLLGVVQVGTAQLAILQAENNFRTSSAQLTTLVGTNYFVTAPAADTVEHPLQPIDSAAVMQIALAGPTIQSAEASVSAAEAARRSAKTTYLPTITANASFGGSGAAAVYGLNSNPFPYSKSLGINMSYPLFNRWQRENSIATAEINVENADAQVHAARLSAQQNVLTGIATLRNAEESMRVQQDNVLASQEGLRIAQQRYNLGASTLLDVLTAQQALVNAQQQLIQARLNYRNARAQIEAAIGRDLP